MRVFMIEWWNETQGRFMQEYYTRMESAAGRFVQIRDDIPNSDPAMETLTVSVE